MFHYIFDGKNERERESERERERGKRWGEIEITINNYFYLFE